VEPINRRRFLGNASVLTAAVLGPGAGPSNENGQVIDLDGDDPDGRLATLAWAGLERRRSGLPVEYRARLAAELAVIRDRGVARRFLAAAEVVRFARERGIALSPGRGAAPSSLVAYALGATGIDPLSHQLIFERFLNAHLASAPAICLDVCARRSPEVVDHAVVHLGGRPELVGDATAMTELGLQIAGLPALAALGDHTDGDLAEIPLDDAAAYRRLATGRALEIHDLEAGPLLRELRPDCFEDVVATMALARPLTQASGLADLFVELKQSRCSVAPEHPLLEPIVASTHGLIIYQEQIMQIGATVARYSLDDGDLLRRALARGEPEAVRRHRERFLRGAFAAGVNWTDAARLFARLERSAPLTFSRSHAVSCAAIVYWAAYLEAQHVAVTRRRT
jgi:DNA polymerase III alpha subunit